MKCGSCGAEIVAGAKLCSGCGAALGDASKAQTVATVGPATATTTGPAQSSPTGSPVVRKPSLYEEAVARDVPTASISGRSGPRSAAGPPSAPKARKTAALLAILLGSFGAHKFYLGRSVQGVLYVLTCWTFIPAIVGVIEGMLYLAMSDNSFAAKFGGGISAAVTAPVVQPASPLHRRPVFIVGMFVALVMVLGLSLVIVEATRETLRVNRLKKTDPAAYQAEMAKKAEVGARERQDRASKDSERRREEKKRTAPDDGHQAVSDEVSTGAGNAPKQPEQERRQPPRPSSFEGDSGSTVLDLIVGLQQHGWQLRKQTGWAFRGHSVFGIESTVEPYVIYALSSGRSHLQVAVLAEHGRYYGSGQRMPANEWFVLTGTQEFTTVLGQNQQVLTFRCPTDEERTWLVNRDNEARKRAAAEKQLALNRQAEQLLATYETYLDTAPGSSPQPQGLGVEIRKFDETTEPSCSDFHRMEERQAAIALFREQLRTLNQAIDAHDGSSAGRVATAFLRPRIGAIVPPFLCANDVRQPFEVAIAMFLQFAEPSDADAYRTKRALQAGLECSTSEAFFAGPYAPFDLEVCKRLRQGLDSFGASAADEAISSEMRAEREKQHQERYFKARDQGESALSQPTTYYDAKLATLKGALDTLGVPWDERSRALDAKLREGMKETIRESRALLERGELVRVTLP